MSIYSSDKFRVYVAHLNNFLQKGTTQSCTGQLWCTVDALQISVWEPRKNHHCKYRHRVPELSRRQHLALVLLVIFNYIIINLFVHELSPDGQQHSVLLGEQCHQWPVTTWPRSQIEQLSIDLNVKRGNVVAEINKNLFWLIVMGMKIMFEEEYLRRTVGNFIEASARNNQSVLLKMDKAQKEVNDKKSLKCE